MRNKKDLKSFERELQIRGYSKNTIKSYLYSLYTLSSFTKKGLESVEGDDIKDFLVHLQNEREVKISTIHRHLNAIKTFFSFIHSNAADEIKFPKIPRHDPGIS